MKTFADLKFNPHVVDPGGAHARMSFGNGYDVSVIQTSFSYGGREGLYELAIFQGGELCYSTPITNNVLGWLSVEDVTEKMLLVQQLPSCVKPPESLEYLNSSDLTEIAADENQTQSEISDRAQQIEAEMAVDSTGIQSTYNGL